MKKKILKSIIMAGSVVCWLSGCGAGVTLEEYESVVSERNALQQEYNAYRESMQEYEELSVAEAQARKIEADRLIEEERLAEESRAAEEAAQREAEEKAGYETGITYDQLARTPDEYEGKLVKFVGRVIQVIEGEDIVQIRFAVDENYDEIIFCEYEKDIVNSRVLENDLITIYGTSYGLYSYESTMGGQITVPAVVIDKIDQ